MKPYHISSIMKRDLRTFINGRWKWVEVFYFPLTSVIIWGLFALWGQQLGTMVGTVAVTINIFWSYVYVVQSTSNFQINEDIWSHSGRSLFAAGVTPWEYITAHCLFSLLVSLPALLLIFWFAASLFGLNFMLLYPGATAHLLLLTIIIGMTWAIIIGALLFLTGRESSFITWSLFQLFIMLSFPLFPAELLPDVFQQIAAMMPLTEVFSAVRNLAVGQAYDLTQAWIVTGVYLLLGILFYHAAVRYARKSGRLVKSF